MYYDWIYIFYSKYLLFYFYYFIVNNIEIIYRNRIKNK